MPKIIVNERRFVPRYDRGRAELPSGEIVSRGLNLLVRMEEAFRRGGEKGQWSLAHHAHHGDLFAAAKELLRDLSELPTQARRAAEAELATLESAAGIARERGDQEALLASNRALLALGRRRQIGFISSHEALVADRLREASDLFVRRANGGVEILASSLDWFQQEWGRDALISLPGLLFASGRFEDARLSLRRFAAHERGGLLPNRIAEGARPEAAEYNSSDAPLWFIAVVAQARGWMKDGTIEDEFLPVARRIAAGYRDGATFERLGRSHEIRMDGDGLIAVPAQSTWMDAHPDDRGKPVTPRNGKPVEINALWYAALRFLAAAEARAGRANEAESWARQARRVKASFNARFWDEERGLLRDVVDGDPHGDAVRPNMLFAVSLGGDLLAPDRRASVVSAARERLMTPFGLRTLADDDPAYLGRYRTELPPIEK
ncbi:MAG: hypothetical protein COV48_01910, partial [Elusimicrobia bacterium CG11_big_fil_rev_8_21_14_0_20_64_6]